MSAMTAPPLVDSVQSSTPTAWRAARGRSARGFGQKPTEFEMCTAGARGSATRPRGPAPRPPQPTPTPPGRAAPAKPRTRKAHALAHAAVTQKVGLRRTPVSAARGRVATEPLGPRRAPHEHRSQRIAHTRQHTPRDSESRRNRRPQARIPATGPVPRLRGRRRHPRHQAQRQEGGRPLRQDHVAHQEALLRPRQQVHQAERATSEREMNLNL